MNQNVSSEQDSLSHNKLPSGGSDYWAMLLDALLVILERWKLLVAGPLIAGAVAYGGTFLLQKSYLSYAYLGPLDEATDKNTPALILSPLVLNAALRKLPQQPFSSMTTDEGRLYLAQRVQFRPAKGADPKRPSLYILEAVDAEPSRARDILTAVIDSWLAAMKPSASRLASLERLLAAMEAQSGDLSIAISQLTKHPELLSSDIKTGHAPVNIADMIKLRTEGIVRAEELKSAIAGPGPDVIALPPTMPENPIGPGRRPIVLLAMGITLAGLILILLLRGLLLPAIACSMYASKLQKLGDALRRRRSPPQ